MSYSQILETIENSTPAGAGLDLLVATKVLGYSPCSHWHRDMGDSRSKQSPPCDCTGLTYDVGDIDIPNFSTSNEDMWKVITHMEEVHGMYVTLSRSNYWCMPCPDLLMWGALFDKDDGGGYELAETAPHAVCLAALVAMEER